MYGTRGTLDARVTAPATAEPPAPLLESSAREDKVSLSLRFRSSLGWLRPTNLGSYGIRMLSVRTRVLPYYGRRQAENLAAHPRVLRLVGRAVVYWSFSFALGSQTLRCRHAGSPW